MPLKESSSEKSVGQNIKKEIEAGKKPDQAKAIAESEKRKAQRKGK